MKKATFLRRWSAVLCVYLLLVCMVPTYAQDTVRQSFGFKFTGNLYTSVADFGRQDFGTALSSALPDFDLPAVSWGAEIQFGLVSSKRWGIGVELASLMNMTSHRTTFKYANMEAGVYGEYVLVKRPRFEFIGQFSLGITQGFLNPNRSLDSPSVFPVFEEGCFCASCSLLSAACSSLRLDVARYAFG